MIQCMTETHLVNYRIRQGVIIVKVILQVPLAELADGKDYADVPLTTISWYHHISMLPKIKSSAQRAFYILETTRNGWSRDVMVSKINSGYMNAVGSAITNFSRTLPDYQSDLAQYAFKDPYNLTLKSNKSKYIASLQN